AVGSRWKASVIRVVALASVWGVVLAFILAGLFVLGGETLIRLLTTTEDVRNAAIAYRPWAALTAVSGVLAFQMDGVFIGAPWSRDMRNMMLLSLTLYVAALFFLSHAFGNAGLWAALPVFLIVCGLSLLAVLPSGTRTAFA